MNFVVIHAREIVALSRPVQRRDNFEHSPHVQILVVKLNVSADCRRRAGTAARSVCVRPREFLISQKTFDKPF
jgi:hypothetical protein